MNVQGGSNSWAGRCAPVCPYTGLPFSVCHAKRRPPSCSLTITLSGAAWRHPGLQGHQGHSGGPASAAHRVCGGAHRSATAARLPLRGGSDCGGCQAARGGGRRAAVAGRGGDTTAAGRGALASPCLPLPCPCLVRANLLQAGQSFHQPKCQFREPAGNFGWPTGCMPL